MADFYVDVVNGASSNNGSSPSTPKQLISQATFSAGNRVFLKRGQVHPVGAYRFMQSNMVLDAYGQGPIPLLQKTAGPDAWIYVQNASNVILRNFAVDGNGFNGPLVALVAGSGHTINNVLIDNVELFNSPNQIGLFINGGSGGIVRNVIVKNSVSHDNYSHGFQCSTDTQNIYYINCKAYRNGLGVGAHGFTSRSATTTAPTFIYYINCEAYGILDYDGIEGAGFQADDNSTSISFLGCYSHDNAGAAFVMNLSTNNIVSGCVGVRNQKPGVHITNVSPGNSIYHSLFYDNCRKAVFSGTSEIYASGASAINSIVSSNIIKKGPNNPITTGISFADATGNTGSTNLVYGFDTVSSNITLSKSITSDPLLNAELNGVLANSPTLDAGTLLVPYQKDNRANRIRKATPNIGPWQ